MFLYLIRWIQTPHTLQFIQALLWESSFDLKWYLTYTEELRVILFDFRWWPQMTFDLKRQCVPSTNFYKVFRVWPICWLQVTTDSHQCQQGFVLTKEGLHTKYELQQRFTFWVTAFTMFKVFEPGWPQMNFELHQCLQGYSTHQGEFKYPAWTSTKYDFKVTRYARFADFDLHFQTVRHEQFTNQVWTSYTDFLWTYCAHKVFWLWNL